MSVHHALRAAAGNTGGGGGNLMSTITLTPYGKTGCFGPTQATINANAPANVAGTSTYDGYQIFTVPNTGTYRFELQGACGGVNTGTNQQGTTTGLTSGAYATKNSYLRLLGAYVIGDVSLNANDTIVIVVGQGGADSPSTHRNPSGGGGTFVASGTIASNTLLFAAGGAGGSSYDATDAQGASWVDNYLDGRGQGTNAPVDASHVAATSTLGAFTSTSTNAGGGGSYQYNATTTAANTTTPYAGSSNPSRAHSFLYGAVGGFPASGCSEGGFGGGGHASESADDDDKGGGGGYLGGAIGYDDYVCGTGGNSYAISSATNVTVAAGSTSNDITSDKHGIVKITQIS